MFAITPKPHLSLNCNGTLVSLEKPVVMGILNATPDSFYSGSRFIGTDMVKNRVKQIIDEGGQIIDIGAYSTRPGAEEVSAKLELERLKPVLGTIRTHFPDVLISLDTFRSQVAHDIYNTFKIDMVNDISGGNADPEMFRFIGQTRLPYILMHMRGTPQTMQQHTEYKFLLQEIMMYLSEKIDQLRQAGAHDVVIDPGFGFSKTQAQNFEIVRRLNEFAIFERPLLVGFSRKSMIYKTLNTTPDEALNGTTVLNTMALDRGANILRVHDVKHAVEAVELHEKVVNNRL